MCAVLVEDKCRQRIMVMSQRPGAWWEYRRWSGWFARIWSRLWKYEGLEFRFPPKLRVLEGLIWNRRTFCTHPSIRPSVRPSDSQICTDLYRLLSGFMEGKLSFLVFFLLLSISHLIWHVLGVYLFIYCRYNQPLWDWLTLSLIPAASLASCSRASPLASAAVSL